ncbi:protein kinase domain-containing protein [Tundrisphaera lichenicola]|uniref:protein kinase domain-containing protein n=1 Tax=Tundrisphaera lichenicola TaxID=2029860 RepID=UPI003EBCDD09
MSGNPRVQELIEEILESGSSAEDVCRACPELLHEVREAWRRFRAIEAQVGALFPEPESILDHEATAPEIGPPRISGYEILEVLGRGGVGVVYKAVHLRLNRAVALKMLLAGSFATRAERLRFSREAEVVAKLRHPNIVQVYDVGDLDGRPYFTMEFVEGGSLAELIAGTPRPARQSAELMATLADAMEAAHNGGIVHRDLKPSNILLTADGTPKIGDFGLARHLEVGPSLTQSGAAVGTPSYMAPEQAQGKSGEAGPAADLYALGAMLYELLTGRPPFRAESAAETLHQVITRDPVPPSRLNAKVPRDLETICLKCLRKDPRFRYAGASALAEDLRCFLKGEAIAARPENWLERLARRVRRRPAFSASIAAGSLLTLTMVGAGLWLMTERASTMRAADQDLHEMARWMEKSSWGEAGAALERAKGRLGDRGSAEMRRRLDQGSRDLEMVADLEEIRLRLSRNSKVPLSPERMYAQAFRNHGLDLLMLGPAEAGAAIRNSAIRDTLLEFLHDWLYWVCDEDRAMVGAAVDEADDDEWRRAYRAAIAVKDRDPVKMKALATAPGASTQPPVVLSGLCGSLLIHNQRMEVQAVLSEAQRRHPGDFWINYLLGHFWDEERPQEAIGYFRAAVAIRPNSDQAYAMLAKALRATGDADGALDAVRKAIELNSDSTLVKELAKLLAPRGGLEEARVAWEKLLEGKPSDHQSWYGYAQLCLFLGNEREYRVARKALLDQFGSHADDWFVAERTSLACLLLPLSGDELRRTLGMVDLAVAAGPKSPHPDYAYIQFVKGLAEYRQGRSVQAIPLLRDSAARLSNRAGPRLVLAMAQFQSGYTTEARETLASALRTHNWKELQVDQPTIWVSHVLRHEAEQVILPNLPTLLEGKY